MPRTYWVETLGCPKNQVDSDKLTGTLVADGLVPAASPDEADLVVVNTCAFVEEAREESVATILALEERRATGAELVVTGCMAERYGDELARALPEVDAVAGFGVPVTLGRKPGADGRRGRGRSIPVSVEPALATLAQLNLPPPRAARPGGVV